MHPSGRFRGVRIPACTVEFFQFQGFNLVDIDTRGGRSGCRASYMKYGIAPTARISLT